MQAMKLSIFCAKVVLLSCARCSAYARSAAPAPREVLPPRSARTRPAATKERKYTLIKRLRIFIFTNLDQKITGFVLENDLHK